MVYYIEFDIFFGDQTDVNHILVDDATQTSTVTTTGVSDIVLKNVTDDPDNVFGVLLAKSYANKDAVLTEFEYQYKIVSVLGTSQGAGYDDSVGGGDSGGGDTCPTNADFAELNNKN